MAIVITAFSTADYSHELLKYKTINIEFDQKFLVLIPM